MDVSIDEDLQCHNSMIPGSSRCLNCLLIVPWAVKPLDTARPCMLAMQLQSATTGVLAAFLNAREAVEHTQSIASH